MLPKINQPIFNLYLPGIDKKIRYRPFTVKEEKLLLFAQSSEDVDDVITAVKQLVNNCCLDDVDVDNLPSFDLELFFVNLRAKSVSNIVKITINEDGVEIPVEINLDNVQVHSSSNKKRNILLSDKEQIGVVLRYPTFADVQRYSNIDNSPDSAINLIIDLIESVYQGEEFYSAKDSSRAELEEFVQSMNSDQMEKIKEFLDDMPYVYIEVKYKDAADEEHKKELRGLDSFFG